MLQQWRHDLFAQQNERYMTRSVRVKREPWGKPGFDGWNQLQVVKKKKKGIQRKIREMEEQTNEKAKEEEEKGISNYLDEIDDN